jgi:uncharacterized membrane protein YdjX (TVP38/TMEM64 family)
MLIFCSEARNSSPSEETVTSAAGGLVRRAVVPAMLVLGVGLVAFLGPGWWNSLEAWISGSGLLGYLVFFLAFVGLTTFCFPVSVLGVSAGALYGPGFGLLLLVSGGLASGSLMFLLGRYLFRRRILTWVDRNPRLMALERLAEDRALRLNFLARLSPLNYGVVCYTLASGKSPFSAYLIGMIAILPGMTGQVLVGSLAGQARQATAGTAAGPSTVEWLLLGGGAAFFLVLSWQIGRMVREAWRETPPAGDSGPGETSS